MRKFNPDKELYKIKYGKRNKIILGIILLLVTISIGSTFALYQVRRSKRIIYTTVDDFSNNKDIILAVYYDNQEQNDFPLKGSGYIFDHIDCDNKAEDYTVASWNYNAWGLSVLTKGPNKCDVYFRKLDKYQDTSGANPPELYQGLIPVYYGDNGEVYVANLEQEWYDYDKHNWANAVLIDTTSKTIKDKYFNEDNTINSEAYNEEIPMEDILQMYVWIPRYKYELFNAKNESKPEQMINIEFERETATTGTVTCSIASNGKETCENDDNGQWYTHPAFKFGDTNLTGFWVGKFEPSGNASLVTIKPNITSLRALDLKIMVNITRDIDLTYSNNYNLKSEKIDTHVMKNMEWGAVVYLMKSKYGKCNNNICNSIAANNNSKYLTGYSGASNTWNTTEGVKASTTDNIYGVYDLNAGAYEFVMANMVSSTGTFYATSYSPSALDERYYDRYEYGTSYNEYRRGHLGDATREIIGWTSGYKMPSSEDNRSWLSRGGCVAYNKSPFFFTYWHGRSGENSSFRIVLTVQDGNN